MTDEEHPAWIDTLAKLSRYVGMNPTQVRWRLIRWNERRKEPKEPREPRPDRPRAPIMRRLGLSSPEAISVSTLLALVIMTAYARVWVAQGGGFSAPPTWLLFDFGGQWRLGAPDDTWRLLTAMFLHAGFWHIAFNLIALATIGPQVEALWGRLTMLSIFILTGTVGNIASGLAHPNAIGIGASGGICGLIGVAIGYGHRLGNKGGITLRNDMLKWFAYVIVFGFVVGADNVAHGGGALAGVILGYTVSPRTWKKPALRPVRVIVGALGVIATIAALVIILTRQAEHFDGKLYPLDLEHRICVITGAC
jgi:rhomboid protease GluP